MTLFEEYLPLPAGKEPSTQFIEVTIEPYTKIIGKTIAEINIPRKAVIISIHRNDQTIIPRGDIQIHSGDVITLLCEREFETEAREALLFPITSQPLTG